MQVLSVAHRERKIMKLFLNYHTGFVNIHVGRVLVVAFILSSLNTLLILSTCEVLYSKLVNNLFARMPIVV